MVSWTEKFAVVVVIVAALGHIVGFVPSEGISQATILELSGSRKTALTTKTTAKQLYDLFQKQDGLVSITVERVVSSINDTETVLGNPNTNNSPEHVLVLTGWCTKDVWQESRETTDAVLKKHGKVIRRALLGEPTAIRNQLWREIWLPVLGFIADVTGFCSQHNLGFREPTPAREVVANLRKLKRNKEADKLETLVKAAEAKDATKPKSKKKTSLHTPLFAKAPKRHLRLVMLTSKKAQAGSAQEDSQTVSWVTMPWAAQVALSCSLTSLEATLNTAVDGAPWDEVTVLTGESVSYFEKLWRAAPFDTWFNSRQQALSSQLVLATELL